MNRNILTFRLRPIVRAAVVGLLLVTVAPAAAWCARVTESQLRPAVTTFVRQVSAQPRADAFIADVEPYVEDGDTAAFIAHLADSGFCLCGADDRVLPVYFYSPSGKFDADNPELAYLLEEIAGRTRAIDQGMRSGDPDIMQEADVIDSRSRIWSLLASGGTPSEFQNASRAAPTVMELPLTTTWGQGSPYNDLCPTLTPGTDEHVVTGCVATSAAQIIGYWKWPVYPTGTVNTTYQYRWSANWIGEYMDLNPGIPWQLNSRLLWTTDTLYMKGYWDETIYSWAQSIDHSAAYQNALSRLWNRMNQASQTPTVNLNTVSYDYSLLEDVHADPPGAGDSVAAAISYHAGLALNMQYGLLESSAYTSHQATLLPAHFDFDGDAVYTTALPSTIIENIQWLRPVTMRGAKAEGGGHSWCVFGYDSNTNQFKLNLGWNGNDDGWYTLDNVPGPYTSGQGIVSRLAPESVVRFVGGASGGDGTPATPYQNLYSAMTWAPNGTTLIFKAGSTHMITSGQATMSKPVTLKGKNVTIQRY